MFRSGSWRFSADFLLTDRNPDEVCECGDDLSTYHIFSSCRFFDYKRSALKANWGVGEKSSREIRSQKIIRGSLRRNRKKMKLKVILRMRNKQLPIFFFFKTVFVLILIFFKTMSIVIVRETRREIARFQRYDRFPGPTSPKQNVIRYRIKSPRELRNLRWRPTMCASAEHWHL